MKNEQDVIDMLIRHELMIKQLYETFALLFPDLQEFWQGIATEEQQHADWLDALRSDQKIDDWCRSRLKPQAIKLSIGYVQGQITRAQTDGFSLLQALSIARDIENALLEKQFSKMNDCAAGDVKSVLIEIASETERHRRSLAEAIDAEKQRYR